MTLPSTVARNDYVGTGALATYSYNFKIFSDTDLLVSKRVSGQPTDTTLVLTTDYTVTGAGDPSGGTITLTAGNLPTGDLLTIRRVRPLSQLTDISNQGPFFARTHEDKFDDLTMQSQQIQDDLGRSIKLPETEAGTPAKTLLPDATARANQVLGFDVNGDPIAVGGAGNLTASAIGAFVIQQATEYLMRQALNIEGQSQSTISVDQDDFALANLSIITKNIDLTANVKITGFTISSTTNGQRGGRILIVINVDATFTLTLGHEDANSAAESRMITTTGADFALAPGKLAVLVYDDVNADRWRQIL